MNFLNEKLVFFDKYKEHTYYPLGATTRQVGSDGQVFVNSKPTVMFRDHMFATKDPKMAHAMVSNDLHFERPEHYYVAAESLPEDLGRIYPTLHRENRRAICHALIKGATVADAKKAINTKLEPKATDDAPQPPSTAPQCPFCNMPFAGQKNVHATMLVHVQTQHQDEVQKNPDWQKMIA